VFFSVLLCCVVFFSVLFGSLFPALKFEMMLFAISSAFFTRAEHVLLVRGFSCGAANVAKVTRSNCLSAAGDGVDKLANEPSVVGPFHFSTANGDEDETLVDGVGCGVSQNTSSGIWHAFYNSNTTALPASLAFRAVCESR
jgi:hypothetical protein